MREKYFQIKINGLHDRGVIGYTSGVFDLLHDGHRNYLRQCKDKCDFFIIGVDEDSLVKKNKGEDRPIQNVDLRIQFLHDENMGDFIFKKSNSFEELASTISPHKYFIPDNRLLCHSRLNLISILDIELVIIRYTEGISTTSKIENLYK